jgi:hypothetical protein
VRGSVKIPVIAFLLVIVLSGGGVGSFLYLRNENIEEVATFQSELRNGLVASCERNGNPLREAVQGMLREQIKRSDPATIRRYFPQIPDAELDRLLREQKQADLATIHRIAPVDCSDLYPK